jgi:RNA polymerase sigma-70 factor, ECF subfamily
MMASVSTLPFRRAERASVPVPPHEEVGVEGAVEAAPTSERPAKLSAEAENRLRLMVTANFDFIWRSLRGLGVPASIADDATQQVFLVASAKLATIATGAERAFLFSTARGVASNMRRSIARRREDAADVGTLALAADGSPDPEQALAAAQGKKLLEQVLETLPEELRTVFVLFELEGLTTVAIAELLGIPVGTAASRLRRAREEFQSTVTRLQLRRPTRRVT